MKLIKQIAIVGALAASLLVSSSIFAAEEAKDVVLKGDAKCTSCHDEASANPEVLSIGKTKHGTRADGRTPTCTNCHGESAQHAAYTGKDKPPKVDVAFGHKSATSADIQSEACSSCHKGGNKMHWAGSAHQANDVACASCHKVHTGKDKVRDKLTQGEVCFTCHKKERSESMKMSTHPLKSGGVACSSCHNAHGSSGPKLLAKNTVNETCYTCHAEKRGPFLWEHAPASDNCLNCHNTHGSNHSALLKTKQPYLCTQCHDYTNHPGNAYSGRGIPGTPGGAPAQQQLLRACANCHTQVHGTNHPSGAALTR